jgi:N-acetylglucosaminyldiphosphoundecaprenol N-acetyl-beta-D-mannosaminyltransferase
VKTIDIMGYTVANEPVASAAEEITAALGEARPLQISFLNPHSVAVARRDAEFRTAIATSEVIFCDGAGLQLACALLNRRSVERVYGYEFFLALSRTLSAHGAGRVMFLGGSASRAEELVQKYRQDYPGIREITCLCPPFRQKFSPADLADMTRAIEQFRPDVLWIGLGSPKQEVVMHALRRQPGVPCTAAIGAVFDFYTGHVAHAPGWVRRAGLQWLHRLVLEPRRLWRRTFVSGPQFAFEVLRSLLTKTPPARAGR